MKNVKFRVDKYNIGQIKELVIDNIGMTISSSLKILHNYFQHNCISVSQLCDLGYEVKFSKERVDLCLGCDSVSGSREGGLYLFPLVNLVSLSSPVTIVLNIESQTPDIECLTGIVDLQTHLTVSFVRQYVTIDRRNYPVSTSSSNGVAVGARISL